MSVGVIVVWAAAFVAGALLPLIIDWLVWRTREKA